jgi:hypothetical protein
MSLSFSVLFDDKEGNNCLSINYAPSQFKITYQRQLKEKPNERAELHIFLSKKQLEEFSAGVITMLERY